MSIVKERGGDSERNQETAEFTACNARKNGELEHDEQRL